MVCHKMIYIVTTQSLIIMSTVILLQAEIASHEPRIKAVCSNGQSMMDAGHFGADDIQKKIAQLEARWAGINEHAQTRQQSLTDAHQAQQYFSEAQEAESWMKEKEPMVAGRDYGKDEDSAQVRYIIHA